VAEKLAEIRAESLQTLADATYANANRLFKLGEI
jgi:Tat protein secretion system quality control protein TatD with DNase activity